MTYPRGGSEFGGYPGLIQPEPHKVSDSATEQLMLTYLTDTDDASSTPESVADAIRAQSRKDRPLQND